MATSAALFSTQWYEKRVCCPDQDDTKRPVIILSSESFHEEEGEKEASSFSLRKPRSAALKLLKVSHLDPP